MGLDISAYSELTPVAVGGVSFYQMDAFKGREEGIELGVQYAPGDTFGFRAGSYSGYGEWRELLAKLAGYEALEYEHLGEKEVSHAAGAWAKTEGPFWELINFADNEGTLGPVVCKKLLADFEKFEPDATALGGWFLDRYRCWMRACQMAANNGAIAFH